MLSSISWLQYLSALAILVTGYYSVVIFIYYRSEINAFLNGKNRDATSSEPTSVHKTVMGGTRGNTNETLLASEELRFDSELTNEEN